MFSQEFIEKVRDANNIVDLFSEYTQFKRSGGRLMGLCPFPGHLEKTPSFSVSEDKQVYHCFGCQRSGSIFTALEELKGLNFPEAVEYLANRAGIMLPAESIPQKVNQQNKSHREKLLQTNEIAAQYFHQTFLKLTAAHPVRKYCEKRGLTPELIKLFQVGYAPAIWEGLTQKLKQAHVPMSISSELGLTRKRKESDGHFDLFRDRLMFPIESHKGECVGFGGRSLTDEQMPKYLNSPESELFSKGKIFYGLNETAKHIRAEGQAIVVEGYMDFLALYGVGIKNVVATLGTALTPFHAKLINRYTTNVIVLFDGDDAGQAAAERSLPILLTEGLMPKAIFLPNQLDPDEYVKEKGVKSLRELIVKAPDLFSVVLDKHLRDYRGTPADKVKLIDTMSPILGSAIDQRLRDLYIAEMAQKISVDLPWIQKQLSQLKGPHAKVAENRPSAPGMPRDVMGITPKINLEGAPKAELFLLNMALMDSERFNAITETGVSKELSHHGAREMFEKAEGYYRQMPSEFAKLSATLMQMTTTPQLLGLHLGEPFCSMDKIGLDKLMGDCVRQVKEKHLRRQTREIATSLRSATSEEQLQKLEQIMNIQKNKQTLRRDRES